MDELRWQLMMWVAQTTDEVSLADNWWWDSQTTDDESCRRLMMRPADNWWGESWRQLMRWVLQTTDEVSPADNWWGESCRQLMKKLADNWWRVSQTEDAGRRHDKSFNKQWWVCRQLIVSLADRRCWIRRYNLYWGPVVPRPLSTIWRICNNGELVWVSILSIVRKKDFFVVYFTVGNKESLTSCISLPNVCTLLKNFVTHKLFNFYIYGYSNI